MIENDDDLVDKTMIHPGSTSIKRLIRYALPVSWSWLVLSMLVGIENAIAQTADLSDIAGRYEIISQPQPVETGDKIEIVDAFRYGCPACYRFLWDLYGKVPIVG